MAILPIITYPDKLLEKKTKKIADVKDPELKELVLDMLETLEKNKGLGLAANQVGKSWRLCVIRLDGKTHILINPQYKSKSWGKEIAEEGCLSFPGQFFPVKRHKKVKVTAQDRRGNKIILEADGMLSRALQHEIDHLDGVLFTSRKAKIRLNKK